MIVRAVEVQVKPERAAEFIAATLENHRGSLREPGVLRFDVLQSAEDPAGFLLYEVYRDEAATQAHKQTAHYEAWRKAVEPLLAAPRKGRAFNALAPTDPKAWQRTPHLELWPAGISRADPHAFLQLIEGSTGLEVVRPAELARVEVRLEA